MYRIATPLYDVNDLYQNAQCFQNYPEVYNKKSKKAKQNSKVCTQYMIKYLNLY